MTQINIKKKEIPEGSHLLIAEINGEVVLREYFDLKLMIQEKMNDHINWVK